VRSEIDGDLTTADEEGIRQAWGRAATLEAMRAMGFWGTILAYLYGRIVDREQGVHTLPQLLSQLRQENSRWELAFALQHLALLLLEDLPDGAEQVEAGAVLSEALAICEALGDDRESGYTLRWLGQLRRFQNAFQRE
jgi:hypothetical protein